MTVAVSPDLRATGSLYATLPTEDRVGLPVHINAAFSSRSDGKRVFFESTTNALLPHEVLWNRALLEAAAEALAGSLERMPELIGPEATWRMLLDAKALRDRATRTDVGPVFASFFDALLVVVTNARITPNVDGELTCELLVPPPEAIYENTPAPTALVLELVCADLRSLVIEARVNEYRLGNLTLDALTKVLLQQGLDVIKARPETKRTASAIRRSTVACSD